jgi:hypothetical protein
VNTDPDYLEEGSKRSATGGDRLVPGRAAEPTFEDLIREGFARYDPVALGGATGILAGLGLFLATVVLLLQEGTSAKPMLSLLGNYFVGYRVTWSGAWLGLVEAGAAGFAFGWLLARLVNAVIAWEQRGLEAAVERARALPLIDGTD